MRCVPGERFPRTVVKYKEFMKRGRIAEERKEGYEEEGNMLREVSLCAFLCPLESCWSLNGGLHCRVAPL